MINRGNLPGGFAGTNSGTITDCYCIYKSGRKNSKLGFCGKNTGEIRTSFLNFRGSLTDLYNGKGNSSDKEIRKEADAALLGFDTADIWTYSNDRYRLRFIDDKWSTDEKKPRENKRILIKNTEAFFKFVSAVNDLDERLMGAYIMLSSDIDCGGRLLSPIGASFQGGFRGVFDGGSHTIKNFRIAGDDIGNYGLFGYLRGAVVNLSIDGRVQGDGNVGSLCGYNGGLISCCGSVAEVRGSGDKLQMGGLVGCNEGIIKKSYVAVSVHGAVVPLVPIGVVAAGIALMGTVGFMVIPAAKAVDQIYAPVEPDRNQIIVPPSEEPVSSGDDKADPSGPMNRLSFRFDETLHIDPSTGDCFINFSNPSYSSNKIVIRLESSDDRTLMAQSGAVEPGHGLKHLELTDAGYDKINSGIRSGYIVLKAYRNEDDSRSMLDTELPVHIVIE